MQSATPDMSHAPRHAPGRARFEPDLLTGERRHPRGTGELRRFSLLRGLDDEQLAHVVTILRAITVQPGEVVVYEGEAGSELFLIEEGEVEILKAGGDVPVARLGPGQDFGAMALAGRKARTATIRAVVPSRLLVLSTEELGLVDEVAEQSSTVVMLRNVLASHMSYLDRESSRTVEALRRQLEEHQARVSLGTFVTCLVGLMCLYGYCLRGATALIAETGESAPVTSALLLVYAASLFIMIRRSGFPLSEHGLTMKGWRPALQESLVWTTAFIVGVTLLKLLLLRLVPALHGEPLFSLRGFTKYTPLKSVGLAVSYAIFAPAQEFVARGALQGSFQRFLAGRWTTARSIVLATLLFGTTHLHLSEGYAVVALVPGIFWGILFARQKTLFGVSVSHVLIGLYVAFLLGMPGVSVR